jgi:hypothetical protein
VVLAAWVLWFESGRLLLDPVPHMEPPAAAYVWQDPNDYLLCELAAEQLIDDFHLKAWCSDGV